MLVRCDFYVNATQAEKSRAGLTMVLRRGWYSGIDLSYTIVHYLRVGKKFSGRMC